METTRHFVATVYVVNDGATALHRHDRLDLWLPPGGHLDRDELPHDAARREVREELGLEVALVAPTAAVSSSTVRSLPRAQHLLLEDINIHDGRVGHQHIDFVFYGHVPHRDIDPADGEAPATAWEWLTPADLSEHDGLDPDVIELGTEAINHLNV